ncbi:DUF7507 domain-containing protein [Lentzea sp. E54]|uniref:DUF7507 domain-containing protein n=1 Tax=Lentzea xerophila TaxID=3435883 RepID=UPI003DA61DE8
MRATQSTGGRVRRRGRGLAAKSLFTSLLLLAGSVMVAPVANAAPELIITKAVEESSAPSGGPITYKIGVSCSSALPGESCEGAVVRDLLPAITDIDGNNRRAGYVYSLGAGTNGTGESISDGGQVVGEEVVWAMGPGFDAGVTAQLTLVVSTPAGVTPDGWVLRNQARAELGAQVVASNQVETTIRATAAIKAEKTGPAQVLAGGNATYQVRACFAPQSDPNYGPLDIFNATLVDTIPAGSVVVAADGGVVSGNQVTWNLGRMSVAALQPTGGCITRTLTLNFPVENFPPNGPPAVNTVQASGETSTGQPLPPSTASVSTGITGDATVSGYLSKTPTDRSVAAGESTFWYYGVVNDGTGTLSTVRVEDLIDSNLETVYFAPGHWPGNATLQIYYDTNTAGTNLLVPGGPFASGAPDVQVSSLNLPAGTAITGVRYEWSGVIEAGWAVSYAGIETRLRDPGWDGAPLSNNEQVRNCLTGVVVGSNGQQAQLAEHCDEVTYLENPARAYVNTVATGVPGGQHTGTLGGRFDFTTTAGVGNDSLSPLAEPVVTVLLPAGFSLEGGYTFNAGTSGLPAPANFEVEPSFGGTTLLRWTWPAGTSAPPGSTWSLDYDVRVGPSVTPGTFPFDSTISPGVTQEQTIGFQCSSQAPVNSRDDVDSGDRDGDGLNNDPICFHQESLNVVATTNLSSVKEVKGQLNAEFGTSGQTYPGGQVDYRVTISNSTATTFEAGTQVIDILPRVGDTEVIGESPDARGSEFDVQLIGEITGAGATIEYSTSANPCRPEMGGPSTNCDAPNWSPWSAVVADPTSVKSVRFTFTDQLAPGSSLSFSWPMRAETGAVPGETAYNSFAFRATPVGGAPLPPAEPVRVPVTVQPLPPLGLVGDFVWDDTDGDGVQDAGEGGVGGVRVQLWTPGADGIVGTADDQMAPNGETFTDAGDSNPANRGRYLFSALPAGDYYVKFFPPADRLLSPQNQTDDGNDSDGGPLNEGASITDVFTLDQAEQDLTWDLGLAPATPSIDIEKAVNNDDADVAPGPQIVEGSQVTWTYVVTNTGNVALQNVTVTDDRIGAITCPQSTLAVGQSMTCTATGTATLGQYVNTGTVTGNPVTGGNPVTDTDPAHYFGVEPAAPSIDIEKAVNGDDADNPTGPLVPVGGEVTWTYVVTNTGNTNLVNVNVTDDKIGAITCPQGSLAVGASMTCTATGTAQTGQYVNTGLVVGTPADGNGTPIPGQPDVTDSDPAHYFGVNASVDIEKATNGQDADTPTGPQITEGGQVTWTYVVTNTGNTNLVNLTVTDSVEGAITCPQGTLAPGASMTCTLTGTAQLGQYANNSTVEGTPADGNNTPIPGLPNVTDSDPSHYLGVAGPAPAIDIEKATNGQDADNPTGPLVPVGGEVTWTYVVTNTGNTNLVNVAVADDREGAITCPQGTLAPGASMTCTLTGTAEAGQYANNSTVVGTPADGSGTPLPGLPNVTDSDPSHYFGVNASVDIEKATNGQDADTPTGPQITVGGEVTWTYVVTNTGNTNLVNLAVSDSVEGAITCPQGTLAPGASMTCTLTGTAQLGQYANNSTVEGTPADGNNTPIPGLPNVTDADPSHYLGVEAAVPSIDIEKATNGQDADNPTGPFVPVGGQVTWTYVVTNTGNTNLVNVAVTDDREGAITCPQGTLAPGASMTCTLTGTAVEGQYANNSAVVGTPADGNGTPIPGAADVTDTDPSHYFGVRASVDIEKATNGQDADAPAGPDIPTGDQVTWTYVVTNTGNTTLVNLAVTDDREGAITCPQGTLAPGASMTCTRTGTAVEGQYANIGSVVGTPADAGGTPIAGLPNVTDTDPSHYFGVEVNNPPGPPSVDIEKATNGEDADDPTGPLVPVGGQVTWTYVVTNTGFTHLINVAVTDDREGAITCPQGTLAPGASMTCTLTGTAEAGQYANNSTVVGTPANEAGEPYPGVPNVTDADPSHYFGVNASVDIEKATNGQDADTPTGPQITEGGEVTWTYVVTNTGNTNLVNVAVTDDREGAITCPQGTLAPGASMTCTLTGTAQLGQYANNGAVVGTPANAGGTPIPGLPNVTDSDPSHYFGVAGPAPAIDIEKATNGADADLPTGPFVPVGGQVTWTYVVTNTGNTNLVDVTVTDDREGAITCPQGTLAPGASMTCTLTGTAEAGQYANVGSVQGTPADGNGTPIPGLPNVTDSDPSHYFGAQPSVDIEKAVNGDDADTPTGPQVPVGSTVTWTYVVTNTGNTALTNVTVADDVEGAITCPQGTLASGASMTCTLTGTAQAGQYVNTGSVVGTPADGNGTPIPGLPNVTDTDPAHYFGGAGGIDIEKATNGQDADSPTGPFVPVGSTVTWTYVVTNTGNTNLVNVAVTDNVEGAITCPQGTLAPGASMTCTLTGTAEAGQYANNGTVVGTPADGSGTPIPGAEDVTDSDPSHYFGAQPSVDIEKAVNGDDADNPTGPFVPVGGQVTWTYVVTNTGNTNLVNVTVTDDKIGAITCPQGSLAPNASMTCTATGSATEGQYANTGTVLGTPADGGGTPIEGMQPVTDSDMAHHFGSTSAIDIEKATNGEDADSPTGPFVPVGSTVTWTYVVTNTGNTNLVDVTVTDDREGAITCPQGTLAPGASMTCTLTGTAEAGQYANVGSVQGTPADGNGTPIPGLPNVTDSDPSHYFGAQPSVDIEKAVNGQDADEAPGPFVPQGSTVTWTYVVTNTGNTNLVNVTVTDDKIGAITCPQGTLAPTASMTCTATGTAVGGDYVNLGSVAGTPADGNGTPIQGMQPVTDSDPAHYFGAVPSIDIEKAVNGEDADTPTGPFVPKDGEVTWTYVVTNTGNTPLADVQVTDDKEGAITCPKTTLAVGESMTCTATGTAAPGQYDNTGTVVGTPVDGSGAPVPGASPVTDSDKAHHFGAEPSIDIEKFVNEEDADEAPGPFIPENGDVTWTYVVTNTGNTPLADVAVTDDKEGAITCPKTTLAVGESMTCTATGTAAPGQYDNTGTVVGTPVDGSGAPVPGASPVTDSDKAHHFGAKSSIDIEKFVNEEDADEAPGPFIPENGDVTWTYKVTNTGNTDLSGVVVKDDKEGDITCPKTDLAVGESMTCTLTGKAVAGAYKNTGSVTGNPVDDGGQPIPGATPVTDTDDANYFGATPGVKIVKKTNGDDANTAPGPQVIQGSSVTWTYEVTNTGNVPLTTIKIMDDVEGEISCPDAPRVLAPGTSMTCTKKGTAVLGQYKNTATVTGVPSTSDGTPIEGLTPVSATDPSHYLGQAPPLPYTPGGSPKPGQLALTGPPLPLPGLALTGVLLALVGAAALTLVARRRKG